MGESQVLQYGVLDRNERSIVRDNVEAMKRDVETSTLIQDKGEERDTY